MQDKGVDPQFLAPTDLKQAVELLGQFDGHVTILAGGTSVTPRINYYELRPEALMYVGRLGLDYIKQEGGKLVIGAATPVAKLATSDLIASHAMALAEAARGFGSAAIRTMATVGGNLANASPAADLVPPLIVLGAELLLTSAKGDRTVAVQDFFTGPSTTALRPGEFIVQISMPVSKGKSTYLRLGRRRAQTLSVVSAAVWVAMEGTACTQARIAMGSVAPVPLRCIQAEKVIEGEKLTVGLISECAAQALAESNPIDDQRGSAWYRRKAGVALVERALAQATGISS